jgi:hypothetical protein
MVLDLFERVGQRVSQTADSLELTGHLYLIIPVIKNAELCGSKQN